MQTLKVMCFLFGPPTVLSLLFTQKIDWQFYVAWFVVLIIFIIIISAGNNPDGPGPEYDTDHMNAAK